MSQGKIPILGNWDYIPFDYLLLTQVNSGDLESQETDLLFALLYRVRIWEARLQAQGSYSYDYSYTTSGGTESGIAVTWSCDQNWTWSHLVDVTFDVTTAPVCDLGNEFQMGLIESNGEYSENMGTAKFLSAVSPISIDSITGTYTETWTKLTGATGVGSSYVFSTGISSLGGAQLSWNPLVAPVMIQSDENFTGRFIYFANNEVRWAFFLDFAISTTSDYLITRNFGTEPNPPLSFDTTGDTEFVQNQPNGTIKNFVHGGNACGSVKLQTPNWRTSGTYEVSNDLFAGASLGSDYDIQLTLNPKTSNSWDGIWNDNGTTNKNPLTLR